LLALVHYDRRLLGLPTSLIENDAVFGALERFVPVGVLSIELVPLVLLLDAGSVFEERAPPVKSPSHNI
jgi:hypothetical protein